LIVTAAPPDPPAADALGAAEALSDGAALAVGPTEALEAGVALGLEQAATSTMMAITVPSLMMCLM
jgi:hypothetical protein